MKLLGLLEQEQGLTSQLFTLSVIIVTLLHLLRLKSSSPVPANSLHPPCPLTPQWSSWPPLSGLNTGKHPPPSSPPQ